MITKELLDYINYQLDHGQSWEATRRDLSVSGWSVSILDEAYAQIKKEKEASIAEKVPSPMVEVSAKKEASVVETPKIEPSNLSLKRTPIDAAASGISVPNNPKQEEPKSGKKTGLIIAAVIVILVIFGGVAFAYFNYINSDSVLSKIFASNQALESGEFSGNVSFEYTPSDSIKESIATENVEINKLQGSFNLSGKYNFKDKENAKMDFAMKINSKSDSNKDFIFDSEAKVIDNNFYARINDFVVPEELDQSVSSVKSQILSKWIKFSIPEQDGKNFSAYLNEYKNTVQKNSAETRAKLLKAANLQFQGFENSNNILCSKFKVILDRQKTKELAIVMAKENGASEEEINKSIKDFDTSFNEFTKDLNINISVGVFDSLVHKTSISFTSSTNEGTIKAEITLISKNENKDISIENITESTDANRLYEEIVSSIAIANKEHDTAIKDAIAEVATVAKNYYDVKKTYIGFDTAIEGEKLIRESINSYGGNATIVSTSKDKYCINKDLVDVVGTSWCSDSTGYTGNGTCDVKKVVCTGVETSTPTTTPTETTPEVVNPEGTIVVPTEQPTVEKSETEKLIDSLASSLQAHNAAKGTYLGYISSAAGISALKKINAEGEQLIVATSKAKFCLMKKIETNYYCVDSSGYSGPANYCASKNISCELVNQ